MYDLRHRGGQRHIHGLRVHRSRATRSVVFYLVDWYVPKCIERCISCIDDITVMEKDMGKMSELHLQIEEMILNTFMPIAKIAEVLNVPVAWVHEVALQLQAEDE